jgi:transcriptional regulator with XRE-family HTH domain
MDLDWRARAWRLLKQKGLSMKAASLKIGGRPGRPNAKADTQVRDWLNRGVEPGIDKFCKLAAVLGVSPLVLLQGDERFQLTVPLLGISTAAERWRLFEEPSKGRPPERVDFDFNGDRDVFAIEIRGDAMSPAYRDRDQIFCQRRAGKRFDNLIGLDCALKTADGETFIKILDKGTVAGRYTLRSYNPLSKPIEDVEIEWAAPIVWIRRSG